MTHPYFEVTKYPRHRSEAVELHEALSDLIRNPQAIQTIYDECAANLPALTLGQAHPLIWTEALQNLTAAGALRALLERVKPRARAGARIQKIIQAIVDAQTGKEKKIFSDNLLVLDRDDLRIRLDELSPDESPIKVLLVRGGPKTGKSHGRYLFEQFAMDQGSPSVYLYPEILVTVEDLIQQLFSALEASDEVPAAFTTDDAYYQKACVKLMEVAGKKKQRLWIAVDDLGPGEDGAPLMDAEIKRFCERFALNMLNPMFRNRFRLMLIHYPEGEVPSKWKNDFWTEDRTSDADLQQTHVADLLKAWSIAKDRKIVDEELNKLAVEVVEKAEVPAPAGQPQKPRLQRIHEELKATLRRLENTPS